MSAEEFRGMPIAIKLWSTPFLQTLGSSKSPFEVSNSKGLLMKFIVEFQLKPESKNKVVDLFELHGPNRSPGVKFCSAWIGTRSDVAFVLVESAEEGLVENVAQSWSEHGVSQVHPVTDLEQY